MKDDDDDDGGKTAALFEEAFAKLQQGLRELADKLGDLNSLYPVTREFLKRCGATHVKQLTPAQLVELKAYLQAEHDALFGSDKPLN